MPLTEQQSKILLGVWNLESGQFVTYKLHTFWQFGQWAAYREHQPFCEADLRAVIQHLRAQIKLGKRRPECLRFSTLIGDPSRFEEEAQLMRGHHQTAPRPVTERERTLRATGRTEAEPTPGPVKTAASVLESSAKWQEMAEKLRQFRERSL